jgi:hypothetical protein
VAKNGLSGRFLVNPDNVLVDRAEEQQCFVETIQRGLMKKGD